MVKPKSSGAPDKTLLQAELGDRLTQKCHARVTFAPEHSAPHANWREKADKR